MFDPDWQESMNRLFNLTIEAMKLGIPQVFDHLAGQFLDDRAWSVGVTS